MAASLRTLLCGMTRVLGSKASLMLGPPGHRGLLTEAYSCTEAWRRHLQDPLFTKVSMSDLAFQVRESLERDGRVAAVDMQVCAHLMGQLQDEEELEYMEDILRRFAKCNSCLPRCDATTHAVLRHLVDTGHASRVPAILTNMDQYQLLPNHYTLNFLLNHFLLAGDFTSAAKLAYCSMLQEDFSNPINAFLSLHACMQRLVNISSLADLAPPTPEPDDGEEEWVRIFGYIKFPYYDDHFDIKDERFLLGKTLFMLSNATNIEVPYELRNTLKVIGLGLYQKFDKGVAALQEIYHFPDGRIHQQALDYFSESLNNVEIRDENEPEVEMGLRTIDDEARKLLPTPQEKEYAISEFGRLKEQLAQKGRVIQDIDLSQVVNELVTEGIKPFEAEEIRQQVALFDTWAEERQTEMAKHLELIKKNDRIEEMKRQVKELQEEEEILTYFDFEEDIRLQFLEEDHKETDKELVVAKDF